MRRRRFLVATGAAASSAVAGCGYARGGGDLRETANAPGASERDGRYLFGSHEGEFVTARSGMQWARDARGEMRFEVATAVRRFTPAGDVRWAFNHFEPSVGVAVSDRVYLLDEDGQLTASPPVTADIEYDGPGRPIQTAIDWTRELPEARPPLTAHADRVVVATGQGVLAIRGGDVDWERADLGRIGALRSMPAGVLLRTSGAVLMLRPDGTIPWEVDVTPRTNLAINGDTLVYHDGSELSHVSLETGELEWSETVEFGEIAIGGSAVYVSSAKSTAAYALPSGARQWETTADRPGEALLVGGSDELFAAGTHAVVAIDRRGVRWERSADIDGRDPPLAGWIEGELLGLLYPSGDLRWLQRHDEERPLLW